MNSYNLFLFSPLIILITNLGSCDTNIPNPDPEPMNLVFDLQTLKTEDYDISESKEEPKRFLFRPKDNKSIVDLKIYEDTVWRNEKNYTNVAVAVYTKNQKQKYYAVFGTDPTTAVVQVNIKLSVVLEHVGIAEFFDSVYSNYFETFNTGIFKYDLVNPFDKIYHITGKKRAPDGPLLHFAVKPRGGYFNIIADDEVEVYKDKLVKEINYWYMDANELFLKLTLKGEDEAEEEKYCRKFGNVWRDFEKEQFETIYADRNFGTATESMVETPGQITKFNLLGLKDFTNSNASFSHHNFGGILTVVYSFESLEEVSEGNKVITSTPYFKPKVYVYKGVVPFGMIEIVHFCKDNPKIRLPNDYYINTGEEWIKSTQNGLVDRLVQSINNLKGIEGASEEFKNKDFTDVFKEDFESQAVETLDIPATFSVERRITVKPLGHDDKSGKKNDTQSETKKKSGFLTASVPLLILVLTMAI